MVHKKMYYHKINAVVRLHGLSCTLHVVYSSAIIIIVLILHADLTLRPTQHTNVLNEDKCTFSTLCI